MSRGTARGSFRLRTGTQGGRPFAEIPATGLGAPRASRTCWAASRSTTAGHRSPGIELRRSPRYRLRGMHPNGWAANHPYAFRCWSEADWLRYVEMLFHLGANHLLLWPSPDIIPVPLSRADEEYLEEVRRVVATRARSGGWKCGSCRARTVSRSRTPVSPIRGDGPTGCPGCRSISIPGDPDQLDAILRAREPLYRIVDNADGFAIIDSDPADGTAAR